jgi:cytochrome c oxidase subunit 3
MQQPAPEKIPLTAATMGMYLGLISGTMGFLSIIVGYLIIRSMHQTDWLPPDSSPFPATLFASTIVILISSATAQSALASIRRASVPKLRTGLLATIVLSLLFYVMQYMSWVTITTSTDYLNAHTQFSVTFFLMTALHAAHVLGGIIPLIVLYLAAGRGCYSDTSHQAVTSTVIYWHFLTVMWSLLFLIMLSARFMSSGG